MSQLYLKPQYLIEPEAQTLKAALLAGDYIICCSMSDPSDISTIVLESVICVKQSIPGRIDMPVVVEYGISSDPSCVKFGLHDSLVAPILNNEFIDNLVKSMLINSQLFIRDHGFVNRSEIYGKLSTDHQDEIVYKYE